MSSSEKDQTSQYEIDKIERRAEAQKRYRMKRKKQTRTSESLLIKGNLTEKIKKTGRPI